MAHDVLPDLRTTNGWTQKKLEGLTVGGDGRVYAITDNDALNDATGETIFLRLGSVLRAGDQLLTMLDTGVGTVRAAAQLGSVQPLVPAPVGRPPPEAEEEADRRGEVLEGAASPRGLPS